MADFCHILRVGDTFPKQMRYQAAPLPDADFPRFPIAARQAERNETEPRGTARHSVRHILRHSLMFLALAACDKETITSERVIGRAETALSCTHLSYCYTMMPGFDGKFEAKFKLSPYCPGTQTAEGDLVEQTFTRESKPGQSFIRTVVTNAEATGPCV